jgi:hypothetical protein
MAFTRSHSARANNGTSGHGGTPVVNYVSGLEQPGHWNSGVGGGIGYTAKAGAGGPR